MNQSELNNFKLFKLSEINNHKCIFSENCPICFTSFTKDDNIRNLVCNHIFHKECIDKWLVDFENTCPVCKKKL